MPATPAPGASSTSSGRRSEMIMSFPLRVPLGPMISIERNALLAPAFHFAALSLGLETPLARRLGRLGLDARLGWRRRLPDQVRKALAGLGAVHLLRAEAVGADDDDAILGEAAAGQTLQAATHRRRQARAPAHVEPKLHGRR